VINTPEVHFDIKKPHADVGHKNIIIVSYTNHLGRFCINGNNLYKTIYNIIVCTIWYKS
jgi:hypothetical protein